MQHVFVWTFESAVTIAGLAIMCLLLAAGLWIVFLDWAKTKLKKFVKR